MKKLRIYRQRFLLLHLVCIACGVFFTAVNLDIPYESLFERQIDAFYFTANVENLISLILMFLPHIMIIALLADLFLQDIGIEATYCLTRHRKPLRWFAKKCALLAAASAYAILLMQLSVTTVILLAGKSTARELAGALAPNLYLFLLSWLFVFTFSLALNLLSFSVAPRWLVPALLAVLFILILQMRIAMKSKTGWQWNPAIHFYLNCHVEFLFFAWQASEEAAEALLPGLKVWHSLAYFSALDTALFALGYWRARRLEFGLLLED